jgi:hypothetical protein
MNAERGAAIDVAMLSAPSFLSIALRACAIPILRT